jgi:hypothetical protein
LDWPLPCRDIIGKCDDEQSKGDPKKRVFAKRAKDNRAKNPYSLDRGFAWRKWVVADKLPDCLLTKEQVTEHFEPI